MIFLLDTLELTRPIEYSKNAETLKTNVKKAIQELREHFKEAKTEVTEISRAFWGGVTRNKTQVKLVDDPGMVDRIANTMETEFEHILFDLCDTNADTPYSPTKSVANIIEMRKSVGKVEISSEAKNEILSAINAIWLAFSAASRRIASHSEYRQRVELEKTIQEESRKSKAADELNVTMRDDKSRLQRELEELRQTIRLKEEELKNKDSELNETKSAFELTKRDLSETQRNLGETLKKSEKRKEKLTVTKRELETYKSSRARPNISTNSELSSSFDQCGMFSDSSQKENKKAELDAQLDVNAELIVKLVFAAGKNFSSTHQLQYMRLCVNIFFDEKTTSFNDAIGKCKKFILEPQSCEVGQWEKLKPLLIKHIAPLLIPCAKGEDRHYEPGDKKSLFEKSRQMLKALIDGRPELSKRSTNMLAVLKVVNPESAQAETVQNNELCK